MSVAREIKAELARQKGAALIIVLILVATLSFIVLSLAQVTTLAAHRSLNVNARQELLWRAFGVEALAAAAIEAVYDKKDIRITPDNQLFSTMHPLPLEEGAGRVYFVDRTACFNVNSLVTGNNGDYNSAPAAKAEFLALAQSAGLSAGEALNIVSAITDWLDTDNGVQPGGAEDGFYAGLPAPYRTGQTLLADLSELRAMNGVTREIFNTLQPYLCVQPEAAPSKVNVNFLTPDRAPVLVGLLQGQISMADALAIIDARPPGGFTDAKAFETILGAYYTPSSDGANPAAGRFDVRSAYIAVQSELELGPAALDVSMVYAIDSAGKAQLLSRAFGGGL